MEDQFVKRLGQIKLDKRLTYNDIADLLGVSEDSAINYFNGRTKFPVPKLVVFAKNYGVNLHWLITGESTPGQEKTTDSEQADVVMETMAEEAVDYQTHHNNKAYSKHLVAGLSTALNEIFDRIDALEKEVETLKNAK